MCEKFDIPQSSLCLCRYEDSLLFYDILCVFVSACVCVCVRPCVCACMTKPGFYLVQARPRPIHIKPGPVQVQTRPGPINLLEAPSRQRSKARHVQDTSCWIEGSIDG